jgi:glutaredoxin
MPSLVLYQFKGCPYCERVTEYLKRRRITVPMRDILTDPGDLEELIRIGGKRQVPCLVIDGKALYESEEIIRWFEKHGNNSRTQTGENDES